MSIRKIESRVLSPHCVQTDPSPIGKISSRSALVTPNLSRYKNLTFVLPTNAARFGTARIDNVLKSPLLPNGLTGMDPQKPNAHYRPLISHIAKQAPGKTGRYNGVHYTINDPHLRPGKFATVRIVKIEDKSGQSQSFVLRNNLDDPREYEKLPVNLQGWNAAIYGCADGWVVNEKLSGLELFEVLQQMNMTPNFGETYAKKSLDLIEHTAQNGYALSDVAFVVGHNVMVNPTTADIRLIEHRTLIKKSLECETEIITAQLFNELSELSVHNENRMQAYSGQQLKYLIALMRLAFTHKDPTQYFVNLPTGKIAVFSKEFIAAVKDDDEWEFWTLVANGQHKTQRMPTP